MTDNELVLLARAGDEQAFTTLILRHEQGVLRIARKMLQDDDDARDVAQETAMRVWRHLETFDGSRAKYTTWLLTIASRLCFNRLRDGGRRRTVRVEDMAETGRVLRADRRQDPDAMAADRDLGERLTAAMQELGPDSREVIELRFLRGKTYEEIAVITHANLGTVKSRMNRARASLAATLGREVAA